MGGFMQKHLRLIPAIWIILFVLWTLPALAEMIVDTAWVTRYNGPGNSNDYATAIAIDGCGNVYVTGLSWDNTTFEDYVTIKYYPNGDTAWVRRYNGPGNAGDYPYAIAVDGSGNVYVTGGSGGGETGQDYATIKYCPDGDTAWVRRYTAPGNYADHASSIAVDSSGNVYVTGCISDNSGRNHDYATIKYNPSGDTAWVRIYDGPINDYDDAYAISVDGSGNIYVTGGSVGSGTNSDYATVKYYPNGDTAWMRRYNSPGNSEDWAVAMSVDGSGNVYVTGYSRIATNFDYATIKYYSNGDTAWVRSYNGPGDSDDYADAIAMDGSGNVYVTGRSVDSGIVQDYATIKYYPNGDTAWVRRYNGPGNSDDGASAIAVDGSGNVYVTGGSMGSGPGYDYATIKYFQALRGDVNEDGVIDIGDVVFLINFLFRTGSPPTIFLAGDANCDGFVTVGDIVHLINYLFKNGPVPDC